MSKSERVDVEAVREDVKACQTVSLDRLIKTHIPALLDEVAEWRKRKYFCEAHQPLEGEALGDYPCPCCAAVETDTRAMLRLTKQNGDLRKEGAQATARCRELYDKRESLRERLDKAEGALRTFLDAYIERDDPDACIDHPWYEVEARVACEALGKPWGYWREEAKGDGDDSGEHTN